MSKAELPTTQTRAIFAWSTPELPRKSGWNPASPEKSHLRIWKLKDSRWFKVPFSSPSWRSLNPLKGSLDHPKKVTKNRQVIAFRWLFLCEKRSPHIQVPLFGESENDEGMQHLLWSYDSTTKFDQLDFEWRPGMGEWQIKSLYPKLSNWFYKHRCAPWLPRGGFNFFFNVHPWRDDPIPLVYFFLSNGLKPPTALLQYCFLLPGLVSPTRSYAPPPMSSPGRWFVSS